MSIKPILFNTDMVQAILDGRKTVTRRAIKPQPPACAIIKEKKWSFWIDGDFYGMKAPCLPGDILYVRETYAKHPKTEKYYYRADGECDGHSTEWGCPKGMKVTDNCELCAWLDGYIKWHPSIRMPKEAARIWLKVMDVRVERLGDITPDEAVKEGTKEQFPPLALDEFRGIWDATIKKPDLDRYGWDANPWVWVIEFERCEKPEPCIITGIEPAEDRCPCIGYGRSDIDDEPCEMCKGCRKRDGYDKAEEE